MSGCVSRRYFDRILEKDDRVNKADSERRNRRSQKEMFGSTITDAREDEA